MVKQYNIEQNKLRIDFSTDIYNNVIVIFGFYLILFSTGNL